MSAPHPALLEVAARRPVRSVHDEQRLLDSAAEHRMVAAVLDAARVDHLPLSAHGLTTLGVWDLAEQREHLRFWSTIAEVQELLGPLGVDVTVLKGVATEARWYDGPGQRVTTDVDLLLDPTALTRVGELVGRLDPDHASIRLLDDLVARRLIQHVDLRVGGTQVDLHLDPFKVGLATRSLREIWTGTETLDTAHGRIRVLAVEAELVLLLLHQNKDAFAYLGPFLDVRQILERARLDRARLRDLVEGEGLDVPVWKSLERVTRVLGLDVEVPSVTGPRARAWERVWAHPLGGHEARAAARGPQRALSLLARGRTADSLRELRRQVLPQRELLELAGRLPPGGSYVGHLLGARRRRAARHR
ncbi:hypothetical protein BH23ACT2_BH23ACT2_24740 [soil metagenome]